MGMSHNKFLTKAMFSCCKTFSGKYIFSGNANFRKRKIFPCVWLHFKKFFGKYFLMFEKEGKDKPKKNIINDRDLRSRRRDLAIDASRDRAVDRDLGRRRDRDRRVASSRRRSRDCDLVPFVGLEINAALARSLSLSLSLRKCFEVKMRGENYFWVKGENIGQSEVIFLKILFSVTAKHAENGENDFLKSFSPKTNAP